MGQRGYGTRHCPEMAGVICGKMTPREARERAAEGPVAVAQGGEFILVDEAGLRRIAGGGGPRLRKTNGAAVRRSMDWR